jgi:phosphopantothenoylcysteine decarboxylase/phosphopantothenate--cysteine ligase
MALAGKRILLIIGGGIAAYKVLILIRRLRDQGASVRCILTKSGAEFVTPLSVSALSEQPVYQELFSLTDEAEMGHIRLSREADLVVVAPATANLMARAAQGLADDLATTCLLASSAPLLLAPAMNGFMWAHPATQANVALLAQRGASFVGPEAGDLACGEVSTGRLAEPEAILAAIENQLSPKAQPLAGKRLLVTAGPTREALDPVRYVSNHSSGKQGFAIAGALAALGGQVTLVAGPVDLATPPGVARVDVESADDMLAACQAALPVAAAICAAAVADWKAEIAPQKMKKSGDGLPVITWQQNPDILATLSQGPQRPGLVVGFAAETETVIAHAQAKRARKGCDWILANDVSAERGVFGGDANQVHLIDSAGVETWPQLSKTEVAQRLAERVAAALTAS